MKKHSDILQAIKHFTKAIGAPNAIICDTSKAQTSQAVRQLCGDMGTTLRVLGENTPWAKKGRIAYWYD